MARRAIVTVTLNPSVDLVVEAPGFRAGSHVRARRVEETPSGKGVNVSRVLALLGAGSTATGILGAGERRMYADHFRAIGRGRARCAFVVADHRTRTTVTVIDPRARRETHLKEEGPRVSAPVVRAARAKVERLARAGRAGSAPIVAFCGSCPPGVSAGAFGGMVRAAWRAGALVALDGSGEHLRAAVAAGAWLIKLNAEEIGEVVGARAAGEKAAARAARRLLQRSAALEAVVVTLGPRGAVLARRGVRGALHGRAPLARGEAVSTVGCGDAFLAGMLRVLSKHAGDWENAFREGLAVSAASALEARTGWVDERNVKRARRRVITRAV